MRTRLTVLCIVLAACSDRCSCSCGEEATQQPEPAQQSAKDAAKQPSIQRPELDAGLARVDFSRAHAWLQEAESAHAELQTAQRKLRSRTKATKATTERALAGALTKRAGDYEASGEAMTGSVGAGVATVPQASREYTSDAGRLYVKVTDTGPSPRLRDPIVNALTEQRSVGGRYSRGALVQGYPALVTYAPRQHSGKAAVVVDGRYLVEARLAPTTEPESIIRALEALDLSRLTK